MAHVSSFAVEAWTYLAVDTFIVLVRVVARWRTLSYRGLGADDYLMVVALIIYGIETWAAYITDEWWHGLANNGLTQEQRAALNPHGLEWELRVKGSQTNLAGWSIYISLLWTLKACWLFFYKRLGDGVSSMALRVNLGFILCAVTYAGALLTILCSCWPISRHWQINPDPGNICYPAVSVIQAWTVLCTNLTTDLYIMAIPLPMVWHSRMPATQKMGLAFLFCGGLITAIFGSLRCGFILWNSSEDTAVAATWSYRESFVAVLISNVPILYPFVRRIILRMKGRNGRGINGDNVHSKSRGGVFKLKTMNIKSGKSSRKKFKHPLSLPDDTGYEQSGSAASLFREVEAQQNLGWANSMINGGNERPGTVNYGRTVPRNPPGMESSRYPNLC